MRNRRWEVDFLGVLANEEEVEGRNVVFINNANRIQFSIRIISYEPESFPKNVKVVTCFANELEKWGFEDDIHNFNEGEREASLKEFLDGSLLIFRPELRYGSGFKEYYVATNIHLIAKKESFVRENATLIPIPLYRETSNLSVGEFEKRLIEAHVLINQNYTVST